jgi:Mn2+/Fe2+ NRAMP family transporter
VISPILANVYLHYVFDLWVHRWRLTKASGDMTVIRYVLRSWGVLAAAAVVMLAVSTGNFRHFERFAVSLVLGSLLLVPVIFMVHPPVAQIMHDFFVPKMPEDAPLSEVMLLVIAIVGTTVAPWQLFFQESYVVDKRITPRFIKYERVDLAIGIGLVITGAVAMMAFTAAAFAGRPEFGNFTDAGAVAAGLEKYAGRLPAVLFAIALIDACIIGAAAVSLSTAYAIGDVLSLRHSLHRPPKQAMGFYRIYFGLILVAAALVLTPNTPLGLLTNAVQTLSGVLLPSATVFLLLLCNDKAVLGPWVNSRKLNLFTGALIAILVMLSLILTLSVLFPGISEQGILGILIVGGVIAIVVAVAVRLATPAGASNKNAETAVLVDRDTWRMPPLDELSPAPLTQTNRIWLIVLRGYLIVAAGLVLIRIVTLAVGHAGSISNPVPHDRRGSKPPAAIYLPKVMTGQSRESVISAERPHRTAANRPRAMLWHDRS